LETSLREEQDMAAWIAEHIDPTVRRYVERSAASLTAGVQARQTPQANEQLAALAAGLRIVKP
jgi:hypothetical protein